MILVNVSRSAVSAVTDAQLAESARGYWKVSEETIRNYGDHLAAVRDNVIVGIWRIVGHSRPDEAGGKVAFDLEPAPERSDLVGHSVPTPWVRGAANPVKRWRYQPATEPSPETAAAVVGGWHVEALTDGRLMVRSPGPAHLESLVNDTSSGVAILRTATTTQP